MNHPLPKPYPEIIFTHGVMGSAKSLQLLVKRYNLINQGYTVCLVKSALDRRDPSHVRSRIPGLEGLVDLLVGDNWHTELIKSLPDYDYVLIDEVQFLTQLQISYIVRITSQPYSRVKQVHCFGLLSDFKTKLFPATQFLLENADEVEEIRTYCSRCLAWAKYNMKVVQGRKVITGDSVDTQATYEAVCRNCFRNFPM